jgi:hypothetical protein
LPLAFQPYRRIASFGAPLPLAFQPYRRIASFEASRLSAVPPHRLLRGLSPLSRTAASPPSRPLASLPNHRTYNSSPHPKLEVNGTSSPVADARRLTGRSAAKGHPRGSRRVSRQPSAAATAKIASAATARAGQPASGGGGLRSVTSRLAALWLIGREAYRLPG